MNFDLRNLLAGTEVYMDELVKKFSIDASYLLKSIRCLKLNNDLRNKIGKILNNYHSKVCIIKKINNFYNKIIIMKS